MDKNTAIADLARARYAAVPYQWKRCSMEEDLSRKEFSSVLCEKSIAVSSGLSWCSRVLRRLTFRFVG